jgi:hypothetical protein
MSARNPPDKQRGYAATYRARKRAEGYTQVAVWVRPEDAVKVRAYARKLAKT